MKLSIDEQAAMMTGCDTSCADCGQSHNSEALPLGFDGQKCPWCGSFELVDVDTAEVA